MMNAMHEWLCVTDGTKCDIRKQKTSKSVMVGVSSLKPLPNGMGVSLWTGCCPHELHTVICCSLGSLDNYLDVIPGRGVR